MSEELIDSSLEDSSILYIKEDSKTFKYYMVAGFCWNRVGRYSPVHLKKTETHKEN